MLADFLTKPLQGSTFVNFRDFRLNSVTYPDKIYNQDHRSMLKKKDLSESHMGENGQEPLKSQLKLESYRVRYSKY